MIGCTPMNGGVIISTSLRIPTLLYKYEDNIGNKLALPCHAAKMIHSKLYEGYVPITRCLQTPINKLLQRM